MPNKKKEVRAEVSITDLKDGEMVWKLTENNKIARNDYLKVKFIVTTFVHM